jgi:hypothetical protein
MHALGRAASSSRAAAFNLHATLNGATQLKKIGAVEQHGARLFFSAPDFN